MLMRVFNLTIGALVDENYIYAKALSYLGVDFYLHSERKLIEVCNEMNLPRDQVIKAFYLFDRSHRFSFKELNHYPLELVIEYLKHSHHIFIKDKLPYIARLVSNHAALDDLKLIFPEFVEEFVSHIYEEEDTLFQYLHVLIQIEKGKLPNPVASLWKYRRVSLQHSFEHHKEEDELAGLRHLADEQLSPDLHARVILQEIKAFDREMWYHAEIENKILFPKAIALETSVIEKMNLLTKLN